MIVFGSRIYGKRNELEGWGRCDHCGTYGPKTSYNGRKWGHVYFIPLIPSGPHLRVVNECNKCKRGLHIPEADVPEIVLDMRQSANDALAALGAGATEFTTGGSTEPRSCLGALYGSVELLLSLGEPEVVNNMLTSLKASGRDFERNLVVGRVNEFKGQPQDAAAAYEAAAQVDGADGLPHALAGEAWTLAGNLDRALEAYRRALAANSNDLDAIQGLIDVYTAQGDYWNVAEMYERAFDVVPELLQQKKVHKAYKKACKKANRPPRER
jgi:tetratricopeptide (TPR) repeat protein